MDQFAAAGIYSARSDSLFLNSLFVYFVNERLVSVVVDQLQIVSLWSAELWQFYLSALLAGRDADGCQSSAAAGEENTPAGVFLQEEMWVGILQTKEIKTEVSEPEQTHVWIWDFNTCRATGVSGENKGDKIRKKNPDNVMKV